MMNTRFLILSVILFYNVFFISAQEMIPLWEKGKMPNSKGLNLSDSIASDRLYQIGSPRIYAYLADKETNVVFGGRLGEYKYYDMDAVIASALDCVKREIH